MTNQQMEQRLSELEQQVADLRREIRPLKPLATAADTFGLFSDDPGFDEIVQLGREYREQANAEDPAC